MLGGIRSFYSNPVGFIKDKLASFKVLLYNPRTKEIAGRTKRSWFKITAFYLTLYTFLSAFFVAHLFTYLFIIGPANQGRAPNNFAQYGYFSYPNSKLRLVSTPGCIKVTSSKASICSQNQNIEKNRLSSLKQYIKKLDYIPSSCMEEVSNPDGDFTGEGCVFISIQRVFQWTPQLIGQSFNSTHLPIDCTPSENINQTVWDSIVSVHPNEGIPLKLPNNANGNSFPFSNQEDYRLPVYVLSFAPYVESDPRTVQVSVECRLNATMLVNLTEKQLEAIQDFPSSVTFSVQLS